MSEKAELERSSLGRLLWDFCKNLGKWGVRTNLVAAQIYDKLITALSATPARFYH